MKTEQSKNNYLYSILALSFLLIITVGSSNIALNNHVKNERAKDAVIARQKLEIDSLNSQLGWYQNNWENITDQDNSEVKP